MKAIKVKRLVFIDICGTNYIGATEYDGKLSNENILGSFHTTGKTQWIGDQLWMLSNGKPIFRVTVEPFYLYQKRWYETLFDAVRRI